MGNLVFEDTSSPAQIYNFEGWFIEYNGQLGLYTPETAKSQFTDPALIQPAIRLVHGP